MRQNHLKDPKEAEQKEDNEKEDGEDEDEEEEGYHTAEEGEEEEQETGDKVKLLSKDFIGDSVSL